MKNISFLIITLIIISCAGKKDNKQLIKNSRKQSEFNIYSQHWNKLEDSLNLFLHLEFPVNQFVFRKISDHFVSDIIVTLVIYQAENNIQVYRESWSEQLTQPFYEDTRNTDNYFTTGRNIILTSGDYKVFINIQDEDSRRSWKLSKNYALERVRVLGPILPFINNENLQKIIAVNIIEDLDTIWLRTQVYLKDTMSDQIDYIVKWNTTRIDSGKINLSGTEINQLYYIPIPLKEPNRGLYEIILNLQNETQSTLFHYSNTGKRYWTDDIDELVGVMRYVLPTYSEYKKLKDMDESSQWDYIHEYWKVIDPSPLTDNNELLSQLNNRVRFVNKNFSIYGHGWQSDRGRIYINYGPPEYVDEAYQDQMGYTYQKWVYTSGKQFTFIDRNMSGDYVLHHEIY